MLFIEHIEYNDSPSDRENGSLKSGQSDPKHLLINDANMGIVMNTSLDVADAVANNVVNQTETVIALNDIKSHTAEQHTKVGSTEVHNTTILQEKANDTNTPKEKNVTSHFTQDNNSYNSSRRPPSNKSGSDYTTTVLERGNKTLNDSSKQSKEENITSHLTNNNTDNTSNTEPSNNSVSGNATTLQGKTNDTDNPQQS